jgi:hypothetical protein
MAVSPLDLGLRSGPGTGQKQSMNGNYPFQLCSSSVKKALTAPGNLLRALAALKNRVNLSA